MFSELIAQGEMNELLDEPYDGRVGRAQWKGLNAFGESKNKRKREGISRLESRSKRASNARNAGRTRCS